MSDEDASIFGLKGAIVTSGEGLGLLGTYRDEQGRPFIQDIIVGVDDDVIESANQLDNALYNRKTYVLKVLRGNDVIEVTVDNLKKDKPHKN
jgi:hypothetical protein